MKQLFKTSLLAATIAATCGTAFAGDVSVATQTHSIEGLTGITAQQTSADITFTMGAGYLEGDKITFTFPTDSVVLGTFPSTLSLPAVDSDDPTLAIAGVALGLSGQTDSTVTYRVLSVSQPTEVTDPTVVYTSQSSLGNVVNLGRIGYTIDSLLSAGNITVSVTAKDAIGDIIDNGGTNTATIATAKSQFGAMSVGFMPDPADPDGREGRPPSLPAIAGYRFDGTIDVGSARYNFVDSNGASVNDDTVSFVVSEVDTTGWLNLATVTDTKLTMYGTAGKMDGLKATNFTSNDTTATVGFTADEAKLSVGYIGMVTNDVVTFSATPTDMVVLQEQGFSVDGLFEYSSAGGRDGVHVLGAGLNGGAWVLNGATVNVPYMPYSANASQILYVTNAGSQSGEIEVTAFDDQGNTYNLGNVGTVGANSVKKITAQVGQALAGPGFTGGKVSMTITVNAPLLT